MPAMQMPNDPVCRIDERAASIAEALSQDGPTRGDPLQSRCGDFARNAVIRSLEAFNGAVTAPPGSDGFPAFTHWPAWNDITHQKMWVDWIRRAWQYGQRVMVALSHNSRVLGNIVGAAGRGPISGVTSDRASSALQIEEIKRLVSAHSDFMAVARTPAELQGIVESGRLAVVLGVEIDKIGDFGVGPGLTTAMIDAAIDELVGQGVRYVLPIHLTDNAFGDMALHDDIYNVLNYAENGSFWSVGCGAAADEVGFRTLGTPPGLGALVPPGIPTPPAPPSCQIGSLFTGHVNARSANGLRPLGEYAIRSMMRRGMLVDIDHMSHRAANRTLSLASAVPNGGYPVMSGHSGVRSRNSSSNAENSRTTTQLARIACLGGMFGLGTGEKSGTRAVDWTAQYAQAYDVMRRAFGPNGICPQSYPLGTGFIGLGTDTNSLVKAPRPPLLDPIGTPRFTDIYNPGNPLNAGVPPLTRSSKGNGATWDYNVHGVAHYGMFADFLRDVRTLPGGTTMTGRQIVDDQMMFGADYFHRMWLKADAQKTSVP
jgi:microsomal dipeptidase-like Zn-dependent dipeptidase